MADTKTLTVDRLICGAEVLTTHPLVGKRTIQTFLSARTSVLVIDTDQEKALIQLDDGTEGVIPVRSLESRSPFKWTD